jgi:uncharacterized cupin superfamily protein
MAKKSKKAKKAAKEAVAVAVKANGAANPHVLRASDVAAGQKNLSHPWNSNSEVIGVQLGKKLGLKRTSVSIARLPTGKESAVPHAHHREEEWLYVLMGEGSMLIGADEVPVSAGDFIAFPAPQIIHNLKNVGSDDLVYLMGGENAKMDVVDFPTLGKRSVRLGSEVTVYDVASGAEVPAPSKAKKQKK